MRSLFGTRIECVLQAVAEKIDGDEDQQPGVDRQRWRRGHQFLRVAPAWRGRHDAEPQEARTGSIRITRPIVSVTATINGVATFGRIWAVMM
jgi:hypothetical protein